MHLHREFKNHNIKGDDENKVFVFEIVSRKSHELHPSVGGTDGVREKRFSPASRPFDGAKRT